MIKRLIALIVGLSFIFSNLPYSQAGDFSVNQLPLPGAMVGISGPFAPLALKGIIVDPSRPLEFKFIVDTGKGPQDTRFVQEEAKRLVRYFLAGLTIPEGELWVNLSPYEKDRITPPSLGGTELGRDLLAQDYVLKQLTASMIYPEKNLGKEFWGRVYALSKERFGTSDVPVNTFNKVWVLPDQAQVFENGVAAYVTRSTLKVMLDEDYRARQKHIAVQSSGISSQVIREIVLPEIEKEVNTGKNFALLRQIYDAMILARWYKGAIENGLLEALYTDKKKLAGVNLDDPTVKEQIYLRYLQAYKRGVFNYIKEDRVSGGQIVPRKYFSGGITQLGSFHLDLTHDAAMLGESNGALLALSISLSALKTSFPLPKQGIYENAGLGFLQAPLDATMNADLTQANQMAQWTQGHPLFTSGLTKEEIEADAAMVAELMHVTLNHPFMAVTGLGAFLGMGISGLGVMTMGTEKYLNKYFGNSEKITAHLFFNPLIYVFISLTMSVFVNFDGHVLSNAEKMLLPYLLQGSAGMALLLSSHALRVARKWDVVNAPPNLMVWRLKGEISKIIKMLNNDNADIRKAAREAVDDLVQDKKQLQKLAHEQLDSFNPDSRAWAKAVLGKLSGNTPDLQYDMGYDSIISDYPDVVFWSIGMLLKSRHPDAIEPLRRLLRNEPDVRNKRAAIIALGRLGYKQAFEWVLNVAIRDEPGDESSRSALGILYQWQDTRAIGPLLASLGDSSSLFDEKIKVLKHLNVAGEELFQTYLTGLISKNDYVRQKMIKALGNSGDKRAIEPLVDLSKVKRRGNGLDVQKELINEALKRLGHSDKAQLAQAPGGIDLNSIKVRQGGKPIFIEFDPSQIKELAQGGFEGFSPVIIHVTPISSLFQLLRVNSIK